MDIPASFFRTRKCRSHNTCHHLRVPEGLLQYKIPLKTQNSSPHGPLTRYVKLQVTHAPGMPGTFPPRRRFQRKSIVSDPGMHHGTCVTHVPWCISGSLTCGDGENVPGFPGACAPAILRIWQEAHYIHFRWHVHRFEIFHRPRQ